MTINATLKIIREMLANEGEIEGHDPVIIAKKFAEHYTLINGRLQKCVDFINKGTAPQAFDEAQAEPGLIKICEELNIIESLGWSQLCIERGWQAPGELNIKALNQLKKASALEVFCAPLLKRLRRANNRGDAQQCVEILRELVRKDSDHSEWKNDLEDFERFYISQLRKKFEAFRKEEKYNEVAEIAIELKKQWKIPIDESFLKDIELFLEKKQKEITLSEEQVIISKISDAYQSKNYHDLKTSIAEYQTLELSKYFQPDIALRTIYDEAFKWFEQKKAEIEKRIQFDEKLNELHGKLTERTPDGIQSLWEEIKRYNYPIPENFEPQVCHIINASQIQAQKQLKLRKIRYICLAVVIVFCLISGVSWARYNQIRISKLILFEKALATENLHQARNLLSEFKNLPKFLTFIRPNEINNLRMQADELERLLEHKQATFIATINRLEDLLQKGGFTERHDVIERLFEDAANNAITADEKGKLSVIHNIWKTRKKGFREDAEHNLSNILVLLEKEFNTIVIDSQFDFNEILNRLPAIEDLIAQGMEIENISSASKDNLMQYIKLLESTKSSLTARSNQIQKIHSENRLEDYFKELKIFATAYPNDPITNGLKLVIDMESLNYDLLANPRTKDTKNVFWYSTSKFIQDIEHNNSIYSPEIKQNIKSFERTKRFVDLWECVVRRPNQYPEKWFFEGEPHAEFIGGIPCYTGIAYVLSASDTQPTFTMNNVITVHVNDLKRMPHCFFIEQMLNNLSYDISVKNIIQQMSLLYDQDFSPILKLHLMNFLVKQMLTLVGRENAMVFAEMADVFSEYNSQVHWLCTSNIKYKPESKKADSILDKYFHYQDRTLSPEAKVSKSKEPALPEKGYTGQKVALDFHKTDIMNVLRIFQQVSGKNFAVDNDVTGEVTMAMEKPLPWDQVLDLILRMNQLGSVETGNIIRIGKIGALMLEEQEHQKRMTASMKQLTEKKIARAYTLAPALSAFIATYEIQNNTLKRPIEWVGFVDLEDASILHWKTGKAPNEILVIRNVASPQIYVAEEQRGGGKLLHMDHKGYIAGEPLFSPKGSRTSHEILNSIFSDLNIKTDTDIKWPECWPVNIRHP